MLDRGKTLQQLALADGDQARGQALLCEHHAQLRADPRRLAGGDRDERSRRYRSSSRSST
jgi:hypothetical protein